MSLTADILAHAHSLGFDRVGILPVEPPAHAAAFAGWLAAGYQGEMAYLAARAAERADPALLAPGVRSMIVLAANYDGDALLSPDLGGSQIPPRIGGAGGAARLARYARAADYHDVLKRRLYDLDAFIRARTGRTTLGKVCVDTAPLLERDFAAQAGLGFIGRNTCLIAPGLGSWTTLAALLVTEDLDEGQTTDGERAFVPGRSSFVGCGNCTRCLDACPTHAFVAPYLLDARRCIAYLTIELRNPIPRDLRPLMGDWVFGCDVCQEVCPYNRAASHSERSEESPSHLAGHSERSEESPSHLAGHSERSEESLMQLAGDSSSQTPLLRMTDESGLDLANLLTLDDAGFRARFRGTPVVRAKRRGLVRNACVAAGNSGDPTLVPLLTTLLTDPEPLVRGHAAWALGRIGGTEAMAALRDALDREDDAWAREEIALAADA
ncbi:MAG: tRNA epoxyqueuosine(34) reductase QueG [Chloroflexi bacterium]|nr:tRNA epoxyqueuosine(34) reductase QueG [Chloroflexota bacterium]